MNYRIKGFLKNLIIFVLGSFGAKFLTFILMPVYTSILTTSQYGQVDLVTTTQGLLFPIVTLSMSEAIFRFVMKNGIDDKKVLSNGAFTIAFTYILTLIIAGGINIFLKWKYMGWMLALLAVSMLYDILTNYLKAQENSKKYVAAGIMYTVVNLSCSIFFLVIMHWKIEGYLLAAMFAYIVPTVIIFFREKIYTQIRFEYFDKSLAKRMLKYSAPLIFTSLSWWIILSSDKYMIRYFMDNAAVGIYSIASKIPLILQTLISILQTVWQIYTNQIYEEEPEKLKESFVLFSKAFRQIGFISGSMLIMFTQFIMMILARNEFYDGWIYAPFLILSIVFSFSTGMVASLYGAYEKNAGALYSVIWGGVVNIILNLLLIPRIGIMGATISTALSRLIIAIYRLKDTEKLLAFDREYSKIIINCILITIQSCLLIYMKKYVYVAQVVIFAIICVYNQEIIRKIIMYSKIYLTERIDSKVHNN